MEKQIQFVNFLYSSIDLEKTAGTFKESLSPEIKKYIKEIKPDPKYIYVLATPLGASEYYGRNNNGDYFSEEALNPKEKNANWGYKTFETTPAHIYIKHINKDERLSIGQVVKSAYNTDMHRAEVVFQLEKEKAPELVSEIENEKSASGSAGKTSFGISMGCRLVDGDICSVCKNNAKSKLEYCEHLREKMGTILPDGTSVHAENPKPIFFDLSIVERPAAREAAILKKVAEELNKENPITISEVRTYYSSEDPKIKRVKSLYKKLSTREEGISKENIEKLAEEPIMDILDTLTGFGIILKPEEFQYLTLLKSGKKDIGEQYIKHNIIFPETSVSLPLPKTSKYNEKTAGIAEEYISSRSLFDPYLSLRFLTKTANKHLEKKVFENPLLLEISKLYNGYREKVIEDTTQQKLAERIIARPELLKVYLNTEVPMLKIAQLEHLNTTEKIVDSLLTTASKLYLILS